MEDRPALLAFEASGPGARGLFAGEAGGHRFQRVPPTERRGRVHTSTVTVAVLAPGAGGRGLDPADVDTDVKRGSGPGGQHRNKNETCVTLTHRPTGLAVTIDGRSQAQNRELALRVLDARVSAAAREASLAAEAADRRAQLGSGQRGDKVRTYRERDDRVTDHRTGERLRLSEWRTGAWGAVSPR